jgi:predicted secreted hydrolase
MRKLRIVLVLAVVCLQVLALGSAQARQFKQALPGYQYVFPRDHAAHEEFRTEWWYYTGHLQADDGRHFGYELTFFRTAYADAKAGDQHPWKLDNIYLAHFAVSDEQKRKFFYFEKLNRGGAGPAAARSENYYVANENWFVEQLGDKVVLRADAPGYAIHLLLNSLKPAVIHGKNGVSQKASCKGCASHYYSMTRLETEGYIYVDNKSSKVSGLTWMDHEFGSNQLTKEQVGWDWYSVQLKNNVEVMLYLLRDAHGGIDPNSSGTIVYPNGKSRHLNLAEFSAKALGRWHSDRTHGEYPMGWEVEIPSEKCKLTIKPSFEDQELATGKSTGVTYWEGTASVEGSFADKKVDGQAYVEMTGYAEKFHQSI